MNNKNNFPRKIHIISLGCKLNAFEGDAIAEKLSQQGNIICKTQEEADIIIVNTCTVTSKADDKGKKYMRRAKRLGKKVIATGCYATTDGMELAEESYIDLILRNEQKFSVNDFLPLLDLKTKLVSGLDDTEFPEVSGFERTRAFLKIQDGCDKFCSFCKIPFARGRSRSQDPQKILQAFLLLIKTGYKEIVLTGINLSDYHSSIGYLADLLQLLLSQEGNFRIRLSSLQPDEISDDLIECFKNPKMAIHVHLSVQSGSDEILKKMFRHYDKKDFLNLVEKIRKIRPDMGITTDIIVGFPSETDLNFEETLDLIRKVRFSRVHVFPYSRREGTTAARYLDLPMQVKRAREKKFQEIHHIYAIKFAKENCINKTYTVLTESAKNGIREAYTENYIRVHLKEEDTETNQFIKITPKDITIDKDGNLLFIL